MMEGARPTRAVGEKSEAIEIVGSLTGPASPGIDSSQASDGQRACDEAPLLSELCCSYSPRSVAKGPMRNLTAPRL